MRAGHGVGFAPVEAPNLGAGDRTPLRAGMVISIEPGVCIEGTGGVLWADNYVVTEAGVEPLTSYPVLAVTRRRRRDMRRFVSRGVLALGLLVLAVAPTGRRPM